MTSSVQPSDTGDPRGKKPRITSARRLTCLNHQLAELLTGWDASTNPVLLSAAGQLRLAMREADQRAYAPARDWEQRQYETRIHRG